MIKHKDVKFSVSVVTCVSRISYHFSIGFNGDNSTVSRNVASEGSKIKIRQVCYLGHHWIGGGTRILGPNRQSCTGRERKQDYHAPGTKSSIHKIPPQ